MINRRSLITNGSTAAFGAMALAAVTGGTGIAEAAPAGYSPWTPMPDPATTPVPNPPFAKGLTAAERHNLQTFDELDFDVYSLCRSKSHHCSVAAHLSPAESMLG